MPLNHSLEKVKIQQKNGFTLAESAAHTNMLQRVGNGFTLAEVLIILAIIGVVAAMTLPTLIAKINDTVNTNSAKVFNAKLIKGLNLTKTAGDLNDTYTSTYDFLVNGLGKNLKMAKVCDKDHIRDCIPYDTISYTYKSKDKTIDVKDITASKMKLNDGFKDVAAFVLGDGTPVIASYNLNCVNDPDKADTNINGCFAGLFDINGSRKPNKVGTKVEDGKTLYVSDIRSFNGATLSPCVGEIGDICIATSAVYPKDVWQDYFTTLPTYEWNQPWGGTSTQNDYYAVAEKVCEVKGGHLPDASELAKIATALYYDESDGNKTVGDNQYIPSGISMKNKDAVYAALGIESSASSFYLWSSVPNGTAFSFARDYYSTSTDWHGSSRYYEHVRVVCLGE